MTLSFLSQGIFLCSEKGFASGAPGFVSAYLVFGYALLLY
jgi:hypothetical protein